MPLCRARIAASIRCSHLTQPRLASGPAEEGKRGVTAVRGDQGTRLGQGHGAPVAGQGSTPTVV